MNDSTIPEAICLRRILEIPSSPLGVEFFKFFMYKRPQKQNVSETIFSGVRPFPLSSFQVVFIIFHIVLFFIVNQ